MNWFEDLFPDHNPRQSGGLGGDSDSLSSSDSDDSSREDDEVNGGRALSTQEFYGSVRRDDGDGGSRSRAEIVSNPRSYEADPTLSHVNPR